MVRLSTKKHGSNKQIPASAARSKQTSQAFGGTDALDEIGFDGGPYETYWEEGFHNLVVFKEREGHCRVPLSHDEANGFRLGQWVRSQRINRDDLSGERQQRLNKVGFSWDPLLDQWEEGFRHLAIYREREGHCRVPKRHEESGFKLGEWVDRQRQMQNAIAIERRKQLDELGFVWDPLKVQWEEGFRHLVTYKEREGHCRVPKRHSENGFPLGTWVSHQRANNHKMSSERRQRLEPLGFDWNPLSGRWREGFDYLRTYKRREGHCYVPYDHMENGYTLGRWVIKQRHKKGTMPIERRKQLDGLGFVWDPLEIQWEKGFRYLATYKEHEGHCRVPQRHEESGFRLGQWVTVQRANKDRMPAERRKQLDELGFVWKVRNTEDG